MVLEPSDFALGGDEPDPAPTDLISEESWHSIVSLPDDVAVRTTNYYGSVVSDFWSYWDQWNCLSGALQEAEEGRLSPVAHVAIDAGDELQASIYNAMVGFYRVAFSCVRNVLEYLTVGLRLELANDVTTFDRWITGERELKLGWASDRLPQQPVIGILEGKLRAAVADDLFHQKTPTDPGGLVRRLFSSLSHFVHGQAGFTDSAIWQSNGPIFVPATFEAWVAGFATTLSVAILDAKLARPSLKGLAYGSSLNAGELYQKALEHIPKSGDGIRLLEFISTQVW
jgi:hypothetical protein